MCYGTQVYLSLNLGITSTLSGLVTFSNRLINVFCVFVVAQQDQKTVRCWQVFSSPSFWLWWLWGEDSVWEEFAFVGHGDNTDYLEHVRCFPELI
jgi:hypothetical protein